MDNRTEKTRRSIYNAFIGLRSKKPLERLTVKELCEEAQINKSTFYVHYRDVYDLSDKIESEIVRGIIQDLENSEDLFLNTKQFTRNLFTAYISQSALINTVFSGSRTEQLPGKLEDALKEMLYENHPELRDDRELNILITYSVYGGYYSYLKHIKSSGETIDIISDLSERLMKQ